MSVYRQLLLQKGLLVHHKHLSHHFEMKLVFAFMFKAFGVNCSILRDSNLFSRVILGKKINAESTVRDRFQGL